MSFEKQYNLSRADPLHVGLYQITIDQCFLTFKDSVARSVLVEICFFAVFQLFCHILTRRGKMRQKDPKMLLPNAGSKLKAGLAPCKNYKYKLGLGLDSGMSFKSPRLHGKPQATGIPGGGGGTNTLR